MPAPRNCHTRFAKWPNGDIVAAGNVNSEATFRGILDEVGDPGMARTAECKHAMLSEVQPANIPGRLKTSEDFIEVAPCSFTLANFWKDRTHFGDITVEAMNGATELAHVAILADRLPALRDTLLSRPETAMIDKATTGGVLKSFLNFLYTGDYSRKSVTDEDLPQLLQLAEHHRLTRLSDLLDKEKAQSIRYIADAMDLETGPFARPGDTPSANPELLELLSTAHRLGRKRVVEVAQYYIISRWNEVKQSLDSPSVPEARAKVDLPCRRQRLDMLGAHTRPMRVWRGSTTIKQVLAKEYADAGGPLAPPEAKALAADLAARKGPELTAEERSMCENYSVEAADMESIMDKFPYWSPEWKLLPNVYECVQAFWDDLFRASFPHTKKLLDNRGVSHCRPAAEAALREDICEVPARRPQQLLQSCSVEAAKIMARADQGDRSARFMELLNLSVPVPLMDGL